MYDYFTESTESSQEVVTVRISRFQRAKSVISRTCRNGEVQEGRSDFITYHIGSIHEYPSFHLHYLHDLCNYRGNGLEYVSLLNCDPDFANIFQSSRKAANAFPSLFLSLHSSTTRLKLRSQFFTPITAP